MAKINKPEDSTQSPPIPGLSPEDQATKDADAARLAEEEAALLKQIEEEEAAKKKSVTVTVVALREVTTTLYGKIHAGQEKELPGDFALQLYNIGDVEISDEEFEKLK